MARAAIEQVDFEDKMALAFALWRAWWHQRIAWHGVVRARTAARLNWRAGIYGKMASSGKGWAISVKCGDWRIA